MTTVMVTGVGAIIGYGVARSLRASRPEVRLVGADIYDDAVGQRWCDEFVQAPLTSDEAYPDWLIHQVDRYSVDLLIPAIEQDVDFLCDHRSQLPSMRCQSAVNAPALVELARDKWLMDQHLAGMNDPTRILSLGEGTFDDLVGQLGLPFLLKPRRGYASKGLVRVADKATFELHAQHLGYQLIAQPIVGSSDREFTVSIFGDGAGSFYAISSLQRKLSAEGSTAHAVNRDPTDVSQTVNRLCTEFRPVGPTNLQFRQVGDGWKLLEINPRISSSTSIRAAFGYNESAMCVDYYLEGVVPVQPSFIEGRASRYIEDWISY